MSTPQNDLAASLNQRFARIAAWSYDHRWVVLGLALAVVVGGLALAGQAQVDNSYESYFDEGDSTFLAYEQYREDFGSDEVSLILYEAPGREHGPFDLEVMRRISELTTLLEDEVPFVYEVQSLTNAELIRGVDDSIEIEELNDEFPETQEELLALRDEYLSKPLLVGGLISPDASHGALIVKMDRSSTDPPEEIRVDPEKGDALDNLYPQATDDVIMEILARPAFEGIRFYHSGDVPLNAAYNRILTGESQTLDLLTAGVIGLLLLFFFRSFLAALAPVLLVQISVILCVAMVVAVGWKLDMSFGRVPTLLTAIGIAHAVHILSEFRGRFAALGDRREALIETISLVGTPCLLTSLTTAAGFASMGFVPIKSLAHYGLYGAFGVLATFVMSITLLMALLSFGKAKREVDDGAPERNELMRRVLSAVADFDERYRKAILGVAGVVMLGSVVGMSRMVVDSNWLDDFSYKIPLKAITERVDEVMGGVTNVIYLFDAGEPDGIKNPAVLREMERIENLATEYGGIVRKSYSLVSILKDLNQAFHGGDPEWYRLPETKELVAQYLLLYEMSGGEDAEELVSPDYRRASVEIRLALGRISETADLVGWIDRELAAEPVENAEVSLTGIGALWLKLMDHIVTSQVQGFILAFVVIAAMMVWVFRSLGAGMISMIPNLAPVFLTLGAMGWLGIPLDYSKVSIAAIAMGIAVDDTIHLVSRFRHEFFQRGNYREALDAALEDVGRALWITSAALVCGFLVFWASVLDSTATYGTLLAFTIVVALVADFLLMPALVLTFHPFGPEGRGKAAVESLAEVA